MLSIRQLCMPATLVVALLTLNACGDDDTTGPTPTGSVEVTTSTTGGALDPDGYTVSVAGTDQAIGVNGTVTVSDVATGSASVELTGVADNCTVAGDNPRSVTVTDGGTVSTTFDVTCQGMGSVEITTSTTGGTPDPDGYTVSVDGAAGQAIGTDETITVADVPDGTRSVELTGLADNCSVDGDNPRDVTVPDGGTVSTTFDVSCVQLLTGKILFQSDRTGDQEIFSMNTDGSVPMNLTNEAGDDWIAQVSPDGSKILIDTERDGNREIYVVNADGTGLTNLTNNPGALDAVPFWSPDGSQILFTSTRDGDGEVYVMNADGSGATNVSNAAASAEVATGWSPDGSQILFTTDRDGNQEVYVMNADGTSPTNLTGDGGEDAFGRFSPDGSQIAFHTTRDGNAEVYVMNADGTSQTNLTNDPANDDLPAWSPDGSQIAFQSDRDGNLEVYVMNADGTSPTNLTNDPAFDGAPSWSP